ncbi:hypothetical protein GCK32_005597 [Trichostrongylus colubriformis]|uniref:Uncharacterized protein n=1 Tax=Trichostrongylus colubriformis TaxID=6319 RepID=A0AAN8IET5_TRICO
MRCLATVLLLAMLTTFRVCADPGDGNRRVIRGNHPESERFELAVVVRTLKELRMADVSEAIHALLEPDGWIEENMRDVLVTFKSALQERTETGKVTLDEALTAQSAFDNLCHAFSYEEKCKLAFMHRDTGIHVNGQPDPTAMLRGLLHDIEVIIADMP